MFEFFFRYPARVFSRGDFVLLSSWPKWLLCILLLAAAAGLAWRVYSRFGRGSQNLKYWQAAVIWLLEAVVVCVVLILLWQPAMVVAELKPQQNVIAILIDDSRSMGINDNGETRELQAEQMLQGHLGPLYAKFQTRYYLLDRGVTRLHGLDHLGAATAPATHIGDGLNQLLAETSDLPLGAIVLLSDGSDNSGGIDRDTIAALRNRHIPVHTVGFGEETVSPDVELDDAVVAPRVMANSRLSAEITFHQHGYDGRKATLAVRDGDQVLSSREITFAGAGKIQSEALVFNAGAAGAKSL